MQTNTIPRFLLKNHRIWVSHTGFVEGVPFYPGNELIINASSNDGILLIQNKNTNHIMLGCFSGEQLVTLSEFHPLKEKYWTILGSAVALERKLSNVTVQPASWHIIGKSIPDWFGRFQSKELSSFYLSELAEQCSDIQDAALLVSSVPLTLSDYKLLEAVPEGCVWFVLPSLCYLPTRYVPPRQGWALSGRRLRYKEWAQYSPTTTDKVVAYPEDPLSCEINKQQMFEGDKLASK
jgi:hypothetical protein